MQFSGLSRSRLVLIGIALAAVATMVSVHPSSHLFRGSLISDPTWYLIDTNRDGVLSIREMRASVVDMVRAIAENNYTRDLNGDRKTDRADLVILINAMRLYLNPVCGDGQRELGEVCDDGNKNDNDFCSNSCKAPVCGDGTKQGAEQCDDANTVNDDGCTNACRNPVCGDGIIQASVGEECEDGNGVDTDACSNSCRKPVCGDGIIQSGEQCDDGTMYNYAFCNRDCTKPVCGNGVKEGVEGCDDANQINDDSCTNACTSPRCGDHIVQAGEQCDEGSAVSTATCTNTCTIPVCGNGIVEGQEQCDDGNTVSGDNCDSRCYSEFHYACQDYACTRVEGFGPNTCGSVVDECLPPPNDGIRAEITASANPMTEYEPTTMKVVIHPDKIRTGVTSDITLGLLDTSLMDVAIDPRCTRIKESSAYPRLHLSCALGTIQPSVDITLTVGFYNFQCAGVTSVASGIFDIPAALLVKDAAVRPADAPPLVPLKVNLPYKCKTPTAVMTRRDAVCTDGFYGYASNDFFIERASVDDPIRHDGYIFGQRTNSIGYFRYTSADHMISPESMTPLPGLGFVSDARWDSAHNVISYIFQGYDRLREQLVGGPTPTCFDPATNQIEGGACTGLTINHDALPVSTVDRNASPWRHCFYRP